MVSKRRKNKLDIKPYRSRFEWDIATNLTRKKMKFEYEGLKVSYDKPQTLRGYCVDCGGTNVVTVGTYTPDFILKNGIIIEAKGLFVPADRTKILRVLEGNNEITRENFRLLYYDNRWFTKAHKERHGDWADRHDIQWDIGPEVPDEWLT